VEKNKGIEKESKVIMKNHGSSSEDESESWLRHRKDKQNVEEKQSGGASIEEGEKDHSGAPMRLQKIDDSWLSWMVSNLASGAKNVYSYFANWLYDEPYEVEINQNGDSSINPMEEYVKPWAHKEFAYPGQRVFNKVLEIQKLMQETDEYNEQNKNKYISKLQEVLDESMPKQQPSKQNYLVKIIFVTLELEAIYGDAGKAAEEYLKTLNEEQKSKLNEASIFKGSIKKYASFNFEYEFRDYLRRNGIEKEGADQETLNKYAVKWQKDNAEINYRLLERKDNQEYFEKFKRLNELWEFDEKEGTVEFNGNFQQLEEWKEFTEKISCIGDPTGFIDDNLN
jgi:hypothetical protein